MFEFNTKLEMYAQIYIAAI